MSDRAIDVAPTGSAPWSGMTSCFRFGDLSNVLDLSGEHGFAAGPDISDETQPNIVGTNSKVRIEFRGSGFGCLTFDEYADTGIFAPSENNLDFFVRGTRIVRFDATDGLSIWSVDDERVLDIRRHGNTYSGGADIHADAMLGLSANEHTYVLIDTLNESAYRLFAVSHDSDKIDDASMLFYVCETRQTGIRVPNVNHGATSNVLFTDTAAELWYDFEDSAVPGGAVLTGIKDSRVTSGKEGGCVILEGLLQEDVMTTKVNSSRSLIEAYGAKISSGAITNVAENSNIFSVRARVGGSDTNLIIVDAEGDLYYNGSTSSFDEEDDPLAVSDLYHVLCGEEEKCVRYDRRSLSSMRVLGDANENFVSQKNSMGLVLGSIRHLREGLDALAQDNLDLRRRLAELERLSES